MLFHNKKVKINLYVFFFILRFLIPYKFIFVFLIYVQPKK